MSKLPPRARSQAEDVDAVDAGAMVPPPFKLPRTGPGRFGRVGNPVSQGVGPFRLDELSSGNSRGPTDHISSGTSGPPAAPVDNYHPVSSAGILMSSRQTVNTADDEGAADWRALVIEKIVPNRGPVPGGPEICIWGSNFPIDHMPLYARFGDNFARAVGMLSLSFGKHLIAPRFFKCLTYSCALSRQLVLQVQLQ